MARRRSRAFRSRRVTRTPGSEGRWSLLIPPDTTLPSSTERQTAIAAQLVERYGILTREMVVNEGIIGGFSALYPVLKVMEEAGRIRRGYFVAGLGAAQFAASGAEDRLRDADKPTTLEDDSDTESSTFVLAATDPANPYGAALRWPTGNEGARPQRVAGAKVIIHDGELVGYLGRTGQHLHTFLPINEPEKTSLRNALLQALLGLAEKGQVIYLSQVDHGPPAEAEISSALIDAGFVPSTKGFLLRSRQH